MDTLELDADSFYICTEISPRNYVVQKAIQIDKSQIERMVGDLEKNAAAVAANNAANSITQPPPPPIPYWFNRECKDKLMQVEPQASDSASSSSSQIYISSNFPPVPPIDLKQQLKNQLEYYFSRENLMTDRYLRCQMDSEQYVPITVIAGFRKITQLTNDYNLILEALRESNLVEVDERGEKVRPITKRTTIILREIGQEHKDEVEKMLSGGPPYLDLKYGLNDSWYVTYETEEQTQVAYVHLQGIEIMFNNRPICARIKAGGPPAHLDQHQPSALAPSQTPEPSQESFPPLMDLGQVLAAYGFVPVATYRPGSTVVHVEEDSMVPIVQQQQQQQQHQPQVPQLPQQQQPFRYHSNSFGSDRDRVDRPESAPKSYGGGSNSSRNSGYRSNGNSYSSYPRGSYPSSQSSSRNYEDTSSTSSSRGYHNSSGGRQYRDENTRYNPNSHPHSSSNSYQNSHSHNNSNSWRRGGGESGRGGDRSEYRNNYRRNGEASSASHNYRNTSNSYNPNRYPPLSSSSSSSTRQEPSEPATSPPPAPPPPVWSNPNRSELPPPPVWPAPSHSKGPRKSTNSESSTTSNTNTINSANVATTVTSPTMNYSDSSIPSVAQPTATNSNNANHTIKTTEPKNDLDGAVTPTHAESANDENETADGGSQSNRKKSTNSLTSPSYAYEDAAFPALPKPAVEPEKRVEKPTFSSVAAGKRYIKQIPESKKSYAEKLKERQQMRST